MTLQFRFIHKGFYIAPADGTDDRRLGIDVYTVRTTPAMIAAAGGWDCESRKCWRAESPDGYILQERITWREAKRVCEQDLPAYLSDQVLV